ncbi:MAG: nucleotidyl transferase AbiEii/AbiGii toxin family protein [Caldilineales bacterium]|nr:nucleotidyl transferase AbiEii/AbiGii toxin family protein [Caldilineales bacterium]
MRYDSSAAFRQALEARLLNESRSRDLSLMWLRKLVAFDRFLARLLADQPYRWLIKGGLALQLRLHNQGRMTKDLDVGIAATELDVHQLLVKAALLDLGDHFQYTVTRPARSDTQALGGQRYDVISRLDTRLFEQFHVDVSVGDPVVGTIDQFEMPPLLAFADIQQTIVPCSPIPQHIAEKLHAYTRPHATGASTRVKDLVDILVMAELQSISLLTLRQALLATFTHAGTHEMPMHFPRPPQTWATPFRRLARDLALPQQNLAQATQAANQFLDPVLSGADDVIWRPASWTWQPRTA